MEAEFAFAVPQSQASSLGASSRLPLKSKALILLTDE